MGDGVMNQSISSSVPFLFPHKRLSYCVIIIIIIITRPKPAYGQQGLAGSWGQNTNQAGTFWGVFNVSLRASGAQLGYKLTWNHKKPTWIMKIH